jgi:hypothetical protein
VRQKYMLMNAQTTAAANNVRIPNRARLMSNASFSSGFSSIDELVLIRANRGYSSLVAFIPGWTSTYSWIITGRVLDRKLGSNWGHVGTAEPAEV